MSHSPDNNKLVARGGWGAVRRIAWVLLISLITIGWTEEREDQYAVMIFPKDCLVTEPDIHVEAMMKDGEPQMAHAKVIAVVYVKRDCKTAHVEIRKKKLEGNVK